MRVMSWNVRSLRDDRRLVVDLLREAAPDVLCLQEAPRFLRSRTRLAALARESGLLFVCGGRASAGPALLVSMRVDVHRVLEHRFARTAGLHRRGLAAAVVGLGTLRLAVGSVHLGLAAGEREVHAGHVRRLLDGLGGPATVVAGDLNEEPGGPAWVRLADGLVDAAAVAGSGFPTFPARAPRRRIDAVFTDPGLVARPVDLRRPGLAGATDHLPVAVDLGTS